VVLPLLTFANPQLAHAQLVKFALVFLILLTPVVRLLVMEHVQLLASFAFLIPLPQETQFAFASEILARSVLIVKYAVKDFVSPRNPLAPVALPLKPVNGLLYLRQQLPGLTFLLVFALVVLLHAILLIIVLMAYAKLPLNALHAQHFLRRSLQPLIRIMLMPLL
jgi:hypothetical protein